MKPKTWVSENRKRNTADSKKSTCGVTWFSRLLTSVILAVTLSLTSYVGAEQEIVTNQPGRVAEQTPPTERQAPVLVDSPLDSQSLESPTITESKTQASGFAVEDWIDELATQAEVMSTEAQSSGSTVRTALSFAVISLVPLLLMMTTCFVRLYVVLGLLRQAIGAQQLPSNQVVMALSFFVTVMVMTPVWQQVKTEAVDPAYRSDGSFDWKFALEKGVVPIKSFMTRQITAAGNRESIQVFYRHQAARQSAGQQSAGQQSAGQPNLGTAMPEDINQVPLNVLLPAFLISELKVAFLLGFQIYLPFLILDLVVATLTVSMGMVMLPPSMVSLPLKLILFVMVDGWNLVIGMLLQSVNVMV